MDVRIVPAAITQLSLRHMLPTSACSQEDGLLFIVWFSVELILVVLEGVGVVEVVVVVDVEVVVVVVVDIVVVEVLDMDVLTFEGPS